MKRVPSAIFDRGSSLASRKRLAKTIASQEQTERRRLAQHLAKASVDEQAASQDVIDAIEAIEHVDPDALEHVETMLDEHIAELEPSRPGRWKCQHCLWQQDDWLLQCPSCGESGKFRMLASEAAPRLSPMRVVAMGAKPVDDAQEIELDMVATGVEGIDQVFRTRHGLGVPRGQVVGIVAPPGTGKSILSCQLCAKGPWSRPLYASTEEEEGQVKRRMIDFSLYSPRVNLLGIRYFTSGRRTVSRTPTMADIADAVQSYKPDFVVLDSINETKMDYHGSSRGDLAEAEAVTARFYELAKEYKFTSVAIFHTTKEGNFRGSNRLKHKVDIMAWLFGSKEQPRRLFYADKHRFAHDPSATAVLEISGDGFSTVRMQKGHLQAPMYSVAEQREMEAEKKARAALEKHDDDVAREER